MVLFWLQVHVFGEALQVALAVYPAKLVGMFVDTAALASRITSLATSSNSTLAITGVAAAANVLRAACGDVAQVDDGLVGKALEAIDAMGKVRVRRRRSRWGWGKWRRKSECL